MRQRELGAFMILFGILLLLACSYFIFRGLEMESKVSELSKSIDDLTRGIGGEVGVCVINERGELVYALNPDMKLIPASNVKLLTCAAALHILGPSYTYETKVCYSGTLVNGTLYGDIIVKGAGDPSITYEDVRKLAKNISSLIRLIEGDILVDEGIFDEEYVEESWEIEDLQYYYAARVSGLSVEKNVIKIVVSPGRREGDPARVDLIPKTSYVEVVNYVRTVGGDKSDVNARKVFDENKVILRGEIGVQSDPVEFVRTVEEPSLYFGNLLMESLELEGVVVRGTVRKGVLPEGAVEIGLIRSRPLSELVKEMMKRSDNMMADHLLKTIGAFKYGRGSFENGVRAVTSFLDELGVPNNIMMVDGSGLSRLNGVSPKILALLLQKVKDQPYFDYFINSLPIAGVDGTLKRRMVGTPAEGRVFAKTGTLSGVSALSGYVKSSKGEVVFSIMVNSPASREELRKIVDGICLEIVRLFGSQ